MTTDEARAEIKRLRAVLCDIAEPLTQLRKKAEKSGGVLNGYAWQLCQDASWLREKARKALK